MSEISRLNGYDLKDKKSIRSYDTVSSMIADTTIKEGQHIKTRGYYSFGDGGQSEYRVRLLDNETPDEIFLLSLHDNLGAELIINENKINIKQLGAYGDNNHDDSSVFKSAFKFVSSNLFYDNTIVSDYSFKYIIEIPTGNYLIKQSNLLSEISNISSFNLLINGNMSKLIFDNFTGNCFENNNLWGGIEFKDLTFLSTSDNGTDRILFYNTSTGKTQNLKFINCSFSGVWNKVIQLLGSNNNSEYLFNYCSMNGIWNNFLFVDTNGSDQFVNYWFNNCRYWCSSNWIYMKKGGHIKLNNCDISGYQPQQDTYLYEFGNGSTANGVSVFIDNGSRYELKTSHSKVLKSYWDNGLIQFNNVDFSSQWGNAQIDKCFYIISSSNQDIIRFTNSRIYGKFYIEMYANANTINEVVLENCRIAKTINDLVEFYTSYTNTPSLRLINCHFNGDSDNTTFNTLLKYNNNLYTGNVLDRKIYTYNPNTRTNVIVKKYFKPYYIESIAFGNEPRVYDNNAKIKVKCLLGKITSVNSTTNISVSNDDFVHFRKGMNLEINGTSNSIAYTNIGTKSIALTQADSNMAVDDDVYIILYSLESNAYYGSAMSKEVMHWKLYNDLIFESSAPTIGELMYEILE